VYLYAHYFVDIPAGILSGIGLFLLVPKLILPAQRVSAQVDRILSERLKFPAIALTQS
jgi:membrane-associated phospholipid phosphatase